jgi:hypothetical protein
MELWRSRMIRLWLVVLLPISILLGYQAYRLNDSIHNTGSAYYLGSYEMPAKSDPVYVNADSDHFKEQNDEKIDSRDNRAAIALMLGCFPLIVLVAIKAYLFVMHGRKQASSPS